MRGRVVLESGRLAGRVVRAILLEKIARLSEKSLFHSIFSCNVQQL